MASIPSSNKRLMVRKLTTNFREAVTIETTDMCHPQKGEVCVKIKFVGINASDVNMSKGRYFGSGKIPFGVGYEGVGEVVAVGEGVENLKVGQSVAFVNAKFNSYAEYACVSQDQVFSIPKAISDYVPLLVSGLTAAVGLDKAARITAGETVLITAAAGGTGHLAVQWAKVAECHVIGTCSTEEKEKVLKDLGCDRVINYKKENLADILAKEYPNGVNVVWETIGGKVFEDCLMNMAVRGRLLIVGGISGYKKEEKEALPRINIPLLPIEALLKSFAVQGFHLIHYKDCFATYLKYLTESLESGKLKILVDNGEKTTGKEFFGFDGIIRGVEHLYSGKSIGKVIARIS